jgi:hypothetical protein
LQLSLSPSRCRLTSTCTEPIEIADRDDNRFRTLLDCDAPIHLTCDRPDPSRGYAVEADAVPVLAGRVADALGPLRRGLAAALRFADRERPVHASTSFVISVHELCKLYSQTMRHTS